MTGQLNGLDPAFLAELQAIEQDLGFVLNVNSGYREADKNMQVGGVKDSAHTERPCRAADLAVADGYQRYAIVYRAIDRRFTRIGVAKTFVHLDRSPLLPSPVIWTYESK